MTQKERMLAELPYKAMFDGLPEERERARRLAAKVNRTLSVKRREKLLRKLLGGAGEGVMIEPPFHCDYGSNVTVGDNFFANFNCVMLDVGKITIGNNVMFAPNVSLYTAGHPLHPDSRNSGYEYGIGITIGDNVWIGGNVAICPGVHIGNNVVIGAGSVVTKDIPDNALAVGSPCRVLREITEADRDFYFKDRRFDVDDYR